MNKGIEDCNRPLDYEVIEIRDIQRKQLIKEGKKLLVNRFTKNSPVARHLQECINFMSQGAIDGS